MCSVFRCRFVVYSHLTEETVVAGSKARPLVDLEEDAGVPVEGNEEVVHLDNMISKGNKTTN